MTFEVAKPCDACAFEVSFQSPLKYGSILFDRERGAGIEARLNRQQHRQIGNASRHRTENAQRWQPDVTRLAWHPTIARAKTENIIPARRIAQAPAIIGAIGDGQHTQSKRHSGAAAAAAG